MRTIREAFSMGAVFGMAMVLAMAMREPPQAVDQFIGQIAWVPWGFAPRGWTECDGQIMSIAQNTALFSLLGTTYGGNGVTTFALPDLRGRVSIHVGQGPGLSGYDLGQVGGTEYHTLTVNQMPAHNHTMASHTHSIPPLALGLMGSSGKADSPGPIGKVLATSLGGDLYGNGPVDGALGPSGNTTASTTGASDVTSTGIAGSSQPFNNVQPYNTLRCIIALEGVYPSRNR